MHRHGWGRWQRIGCHQCHDVGDELWRGVYSRMGLEGPTDELDPKREVHDIAGIGNDASRFSCEGLVVPGEVSDH